MQRYITKLLHMSEYTNNPVYKLMTDKLQMMLIIVLTNQILNTKVSQGSVATHLRGDGILNDKLFT